MNKWIGKWVMVYTDVVIMGTGNMLAGRLVEENETCIVLYYNSAIYRVNCQHVVLVCLPPNQEQFTLEAMSQATTTNEQ